MVVVSGSCLQPAREIIIINNVTAQCVNVAFKYQLHHRTVGAWKSKDGIGKPGFRGGAVLKLPRLLPHLGASRRGIPSCL